MNSRYQPLTSLSSQLRVQHQQKQQQIGREINLNAEESTNGISPKNTESAKSIRPMQTNNDAGQHQQQQSRNPFTNSPATPRLCQRRTQIPSGSTVFSPYHQPITHFRAELYANGPPPAPALPPLPPSMNYQNSKIAADGRTTIMVDGGKEEENGDGLLKRADAIGEEYEVEGTNGAEISGYHRSQSPAMHTTNLQVIQLQSSPGRSSLQNKMGGVGTCSQGQSPSSSPIRHPQPPSLSNMMTTVDHSRPPSMQQQQHPQRSVWIPRQFVTGSSPTMHQQQIQQRQIAALHHHPQQQQHNQQMPTAQLYSSSSSSITSAASVGAKNGNVVGAGYAMHPQQYIQNHHHTNSHRTPLVARSHSSAASYAYQTNSLPRMGSRQHQQQLIGQQEMPAPQLMATQNGDIKQNPSILPSPVTAATFGGAMQLRPEFSEQQRRRLYRIALNFFNKKPDRGVQLLIRWGFVEDSPRAIAHIFKERKGLSKQMIGEYLGTLKSPFHAAVLDHFIAEIPMYDMEIDKALRQLLMNFRLPGEAQKIDHIIQAFARHYMAFNSHRLSPRDTLDTVYILAFAIIMLNTDLHTPSLKDSRRMKLDEFMKNLARVEEGKNLDSKMLTGIYERVKEFEFRAGTDHVTQVLKVDQSIISKDKPKLVEPHRRLICYCRLHQVMEPNKRQSASAHQREIFLFNDMMLICKLIGSKRRSSSLNNIGQYQLRYSSLLIGLRVEEFQNSIYAHGMMMSFPDGQVLYFNAKNGEDRYRFVADINESVAESTEMEQWRIQLEMERQQQNHQPNGSANNGRHLGPAIGARLAEHGFHLPQSQQQQSQQQRHHRQLKENGGGAGRNNCLVGGGSGSSAGSLYQHLHQHNNNTSIASSTGTTTVTTTDNSMQRDSGLPDMDCCHNSVGHSHSTISSPSSASPSPDFT